MSSFSLKTKGDIVDSFKSKGIPLYWAGDDEYEKSAANSNLLYRFSRPACVVRPRSSSHVQEIVSKARSLKIPITIKGGGHSYAGYSTSDRGILMDLIDMKQVKLDLDSNTITLEGGALWGHAYSQLVNGRHDGYIVNGGRCPSVGVSGFILGGGLGPFTRSFGMGCDTLKEAKIVTADGRIVTVTDSDDPGSDEGKLFWALCGAGGGNFGVVVELKMYLRRLQNKDGFVVAGRYTRFPKAEDIDGFMTTMNDFYAFKWPNQMTIDSTWLCDLGGKEESKDMGVRFLVYYDGNRDDFDELINKSIKEKELAKQLKRRSLPEKSTRFLHETLVSQWSEDTRKSLPSSTLYSIFTSFVFKTKNNQAKIKMITSIIRKEMQAFRELFKDDKCLLQVTFIHAGGEASKKERSATACRWRDGNYFSYLKMEWEGKWLEKDVRGFFKRFKEELRPHSLMQHAGYVNFADSSLPPDAHEISYYGNNRQKLQRIKEIWDKDNFFNWNHGVRLPQSKAPKSLQASFRSLLPPDAGSGSSMGKESNDEDHPWEMPPVNEEDLTDAIAKRQWENYSHPTDDFLGLEGTKF